MIATLSVICQLRYESLDLLLGGLEAQSAKGHTQVLQRDVAVTISIKQVESFLNVGLLLVSKFLTELSAALLAGLLASSSCLGRKGLDFSGLILVSCVSLQYN